MLSHRLAALVGVEMKLLASLALTRRMKGLLFSVSVTDPMTLVAIASLMTLIALLACLIPEPGNEIGSAGGARVRIGK